MKTAALAFAVAALAGASATADVTVLAARATKLLHSQTQFRKAVLLEADGSLAPGRHWATTADGVVKWRFVFDNQETGGKYKSATILAVRGHLGKVRGNTQPFLEDQVIKPIPSMTLTRAVGLLEYAGYPRFSAVTMRKPLYPGVRHTEYIFSVKGGKYVEVDTDTGQVKPVS
jgi:hypothetical protein